MLFVKTCNTRYYEKRSANKFHCFFHWNNKVFSKTCVFNHPIGPKKRSLTFHSKCQKPFGPPQIVPWVLSPSITRKKGPNVFSAVRMSFLEVIVSNDFKVPKKLKKEIAQHKWNILLDLHKIVSRFVTLEKTGIIWSIFFYIGRIVFLSEICDFNDL